jgi:hypothetical protein
MSKTSTMPEKVNELASRRTNEAAFTPARSARPKRSAGTKDGVAPHPMPAPSVAWTTFAVTPAQRDELRRIAAYRQATHQKNRNDVSAVLRDVLDFWLAHQADFDKWLAKRR